MRNLAAGLLLIVATGLAGGSVQLTVKETAGIRRTEYPVTARVSLPKGAVSDLTHVKLRSGDTELAAQYTSADRWDDGLFRMLDVDFNLTTGAAESKTISVDYGPDVTGGMQPRGGLTVSETADGIQVGNVRFGRRGWPLLASVAYRGEIIGAGPNGLILTDASSGRHDFGTAGQVNVEVVKRGPILVSVNYTARVPVDGGVEVPVTMTCEMPNSKSWVRIHVSVDDPGRRVRGLTLTTPFALAAFPWTWDFGTDTGTYGAFRAPGDVTMLTQTVASAGNSWKVETGGAGARSVYETSLKGRVLTAGGWGHLVDARNAVAYAIDRFASVPGTYSMSVNGQGELSLGYVRAQAATRHEFTVYQHFVGTPVAIGAATSPATMLSPLAVQTPR